MQVNDNRINSDDKAHRPKFYDPLTISAKHYWNLPHWEQVDVCIFVTFHLADSLPKEKLRQWTAERDEWLAEHSTPWSEEEQKEYSGKFGQRFQDWLDRGYGSSLLADERCRKIVWDEMLKHDGERYRIYSFVVMPTHVHALYKPLNGCSMGRILQCWKGASSHSLNKLCNIQGRQVWQRESWDRMVRSWRHFFRALRYISENPRNCGIDCPVYIAPFVEEWLNGGLEFICD